VRRGLRATLAVEMDGKHMQDDSCKVIAQAAANSGLLGKIKRSKAMSEVDQNTTPRRFIRNDGGNIIDVCHPETMVPSYMNYNRRATSVEELEIKYDDDLHLREVVLKARLQELAGKLLKRPDEAGWLESLLWEIIVASQLNRRAVPISAGRYAKRKVKRKKNLISPDCSISRFHR
jgi:hypothetical protein